MFRTIIFLSLLACCMSQYIVVFGYIGECYSNVPICIAANVKSGQMTEAHFAANVTSYIARGYTPVGGVTVDRQYNLYQALFKAL